MFSVSVIAMTWLWVCPPVGAALWGLAAVLAWARVTAGIHFPRDVLAGAAVGLIAGLLGLLGPLALSLPPHSKGRRPPISGGLRPFCYV